jgi:hypothetical protein
VDPVKHFDLIFGGIFFVLGVIALIVGVVTCIVFARNRRIQRDDWRGGGHA